MEPGSLERTEFKAKRVVDKRGLYEEMVKQE
jgi:phenylacetate-coenzyme A ligase PaaK-like adenylate-forming protein